MPREDYNALSEGGAGVSEHVDFEGGAFVNDHRTFHFSRKTGQFFCRCVAKNEPGVDLGVFPLNIKAKEESFCVGSTEWTVALVAKVTLPVDWATQ